MHMKPSATQNKAALLVAHKVSVYSYSGKKKSCELIFVCSREEYAALLLHKAVSLFFCVLSNIRKRCLNQYKEMWCGLEKVIFLMSKWSHCESDIATLVNKKKKRERNEEIWRYLHGQEISDLWTEKTENASHAAVKEKALISVSPFLLYIKNKHCWSK